MKNLRRQFNRFCFQHRDKGIPNLMLYISLGNVLVYLFSMISQNYYLYNLLCFDRASILQGQVWRLITYPLTFGYGYGVILLAVALFCYYSLGRAIENVWGTLRFNLFYFSGVLMMDIYCMIFGGYASVGYLNTSLFLAYATMYPNAQFLLLFIIPVKAWIFALVDLALVLLGLLTYSFPSNFFSVISLANYFLFFGKDVLNVLPMSWRAKLMHPFRKKKQPKKPAGGPKVIVFPQANHQESAAKQQAPYTHRCTICGRTDVTNPELEFRYCSRCSGYHCYCQDHINNHTHVE